VESITINCCSTLLSLKYGAYLMMLYFDGLCEPLNPGGVATYGFVVYDNNKKLHEEGGVVGAGMNGEDVSNNVAEYTAMIRGMERITSFGHHGTLRVRGDSQLAIRQVTGRYSVRSKRLIPLHNKVMELKRNFTVVKFEWIPRDLNEEAGPQQESLR
jgi:ribonuclease HI